MKARVVVFSPEAASDLLRLNDWITEAAGEETAAAYLARLESYYRRFDLASERGQLRDDIRAGLRIVGFEQRVAIAFVVDDERVTILRLFYGGQDWEGTFQA